MAVPSSGAVSLADIRSEFGQSGSISMSQLYRGGSVVPNNYTNTSSVPTSGAIDMADFRGVRIEGTARDKVARFQQYRHSNLVYRAVENANGANMTSDTYQINNPVSRYRSSYTLTTPSVSRSSQKAESQWTTLVGIVGGSATSVNSSGINTGSNVYSSTSSNNDGLVINHVHNLHRNLSAPMSFTHYRAAGNAGAWPMFCILSGKWVRDSGPTIGGPSFTLGSGKIAIAAFDRSGDGPIGYTASASPSSGFSRTVYAGWWYNNGASMIMANSSASNQTVTLSPNIGEDTYWILRETL